MPRRISNPLRKIRRRRKQPPPDTFIVDTLLPEPECCGCCAAKLDDDSVVTADTSLSGDRDSPTSDRDSPPTKEPCEEIGYIISDAAVSLWDGFASVLNCCDSLIVKPPDDKSMDDRSCCTTISWGPNEVRYMYDEGTYPIEVDDVDRGSVRNVRFVQMKGGDDLIDSEGRIPTDVQEWQDANLFEARSEDIEIWKNDNEEEEQRMIEAAFSADFSDFSSLVQSPGVNMDDASNSSPPKKRRSCACCGKFHRKEAPVKLKICSRCKTTYYCSKECQRVDWHYGHKNKCKAQVLL